MTHRASEIEAVVGLSEEFVERLRRGERLSVEEYVQRHPQLADQIRELFPALLLMEQLAPTASDQEPAQKLARVDAPPKDIGDFQITGEIGRGGMGVVYDAQQQSLRRRVALKVLGEQATGSATAQERFRFEAQAAARLHHANIVPVFAVGEENGCWYYAMQLIQGRGLDQVLGELRRLRDGERQVSAADRPAEAIAQSLWSGKVAEAYETIRDAAPSTDLAGAERGDSQSDGRATATATSETTSLDAESTHRRSGVIEPTVERALDPSSVRWALPGRSHLSDGHFNRGRYYRAIAGIGIQVAQALEYAHGQGIVHRDIKPSNLILDHQAKVWVTDFGLAKAPGENLTQPGDVVGTLRYMAPERFRGWSDPRSDVYGLGITLYELLVLRPAFDGDDRVELIRRVTHESPPEPRTRDPHVPRVLETIVLKATAKEPGERYHTAQELTDDLQRFLDNRPIRARRCSLVERSCRWCRRNALVAALGSLLICALSVGCAGMFLLWHSAEIQRDRAFRGEELSREAIDQLVDEVQRDLSQSYVLQRRVFNWAIDHYQRSIEHSQGNPGTQYRLAIMHGRIGELRGLMGEWASASTSFNRQRDLLEVQTSIHPTDLERRAELARAYRNLAEASFLLGQGPAALQFCDQAEMILDSLPSAERTSTNQQILADALNIRITAGRSIGDPTTVDNVTREILLRRGLYDDDPSRVEYSLGLTNAHNTAAVMLRDLGSIDEARASCQQAITCISSIHSDHPNAMEVSGALATAYSNLASVELQAGNPNEALSAGQDALEILSSVVEAEPNRRLGWHLMRIHDLVGLAQFELGRVKAAHEHFRRAVALQESLVLADGGYLARISTHYGRSLRFHGDGKEAVRHLGESVAICRRFLTDRPWHVPTQQQLAAALGSLAEGYAGSEKHENQAEIWINEAIEIQQQLTAQSPEMPEYQVSLASHYRVLGSLELYAGRPAEAIVHTKKAAALLDQVRSSHPDSISAARELAQVHYLNGLTKSRQRDQQAAMTEYERALQMFTGEDGKLDSSRNPHLGVVWGAACCNLGGLKHRTNEDASSAELLANRAIVILEQVLSDHPENRAAAVFLTKARDLLASCRSAASTPRAKNP